jgi:hypothetical protein
MLVTIDRFEGKYAVCEKENRQMVNIEKSKLPPEAKEGDVLRIENDIIIADAKETQKKIKEMEHLTEDLWN